jgi:hypothetical protein
MAARTTKTIRAAEKAMDAAAALERGWITFADTEEARGRSARGKIPEGCGGPPRGAKVGATVCVKP